MRGLGIPFASKKACARYLSPIVRHTSGAGARTSAGASSSRAAETISWSRSVSGTTSRTSCSATSVGERRDVPGSSTRGTSARWWAWYSAGRERVEVGGDGGRARAPERAHDVDALARAGEEDGRHLDVGGYPASRRVRRGHAPSEHQERQLDRDQRGERRCDDDRPAATGRPQDVDDERRADAAAGSAISRYVPLIVSPSVDG